jgi:hypothetical protein
MANESDLKYDGTQLLFADHAADFGGSPATAANSLIIGTPSGVQIDLTGVAASGGARESAKVGLGDPRASMYRVDACIEFEAAPSDGGFVEFYWAESPSGTAGTGNPGGVSGSDAAYTVTQGGVGQLKYIGAMPVRANVINIGYAGRIMPEHQYGSIVVVNNTDQAFRSTATAMDETHITLTPLAFVPGA